MDRPCFRVRRLVKHLAAVPVSSGPLNGIRIVDASQMLAGPAAAQLLGDQGADVIKVESITGDIVRGNDGSKIENPIFSTINRNKRSLAVDLKSEEGLAILKKLIATADVFLENFRPGVADRLGIGYEALRAVKPDLVYVSSTGFGPDGPFAGDRAYDPIVQAVGGLASLQMDESGRPRMIRILVPDKLTAMTSAQAIATALVQKGRTGKGCHIQLSMLDAVVSWSWAEAFSQYTFKKEDDLTEGSSTLPQHPYIRDMIYQTKDGYITCGANQDKEWFALCDAIKKPEWKSDSRFATRQAREKNRALRLNMTEEVLREIPTAELLQNLSAHQVPAGEVSHPRHKVLTNPQVQHNKLVIEYDHPHTPTGKVRQTRPAAQFKGQPFELQHRAPLLGEHTKEILRDLGLSDSEIKALCEKAVVKALD
eukprot:gnl/MRDRNA2_/MRDRNA2_65189_c0_seq1.p1 gnl/MRDRNA2_/MRDRNA2_65189_c0~~gnl/MRDRNA2_/MRDRNA2_65189_c0_seq1.p1  ORF type:complete len:424 (+),score=65.90 gnl/MRDRNA2_/MRDRNA2_65189_c0_seq1:70-1341(+)